MDDVRGDVLRPPHESFSSWVGTFDFLRRVKRSLVEWKFGLIMVNPMLGLNYVHFFIVDILVWSGLHENTAMFVYLCICLYLLLYMYVKLQGNSPPCKTSFALSL